LGTPEKRKTAPSAKNTEEISKSTGVGKDFQSPLRESMDESPWRDSLAKAIAQNGSGRQIPASGAGRGFATPMNWKRFTRALQRLIFPDPPDVSPGRFRGNGDGFGYIKSFEKYSRFGRIERYYDESE